MKIIAKTKDYYDYLQGKYGVDPKLVYDRRGGMALTYQSVHVEDGTTILIALAGTLYPAIFLGGSWYYEKWVFIQCDEIFNQNSIWGGNKQRFFNVNYLQETDINAKLREPVLFKSDNLFRRDCWDWSKPLTLQQFNFHKAMSAEQVYVAISGFLGWLVDNPPIPDRQTNKEKIVSHGFDLKESFRHKK